MLNQLYKKLSCGRYPDKYDFKTSKFYTLLADPFNLWCDFHIDGKNAVYESSLYDEIRFQHDKILRSELIAKRHKTITELKPARGSNYFRETLKAMSDGAKAIEYAALWNLNKNISGTAHLIEKVKGEKSVFGNYYYRVVLFKNALELKEYYALQASLLNQILGNIQGFIPKYSIVILRGKEVKVPYKNWQDELKNQLRQWELIKEGKIIPETNRPPHASNPPWRHYANKTAFKNKDLILLAELGWDVRAKLKKAKITNIDKAARAGYKKIFKIVEDEGLARNIYENALAYYHKKPVLKQKDIYPPIRKRRNIYFDFESSDDKGYGNKAHIYLIGLWDKEKKKYVNFLAKGAEEEEKIFKKFAAYVGNTKNVNLYHWTEYEVHEMKKIAAKYPKIAKKLDVIISACVDLKKLIKKAFYLPVPGFSLKAVAPAFGFKWKQDDCNAMDAMAYYWRWLETKDKTAISKVLTYNEDDCVAMLEVDKYLEKTKPTDMP